MLQPITSSSTISVSHSTVTTDSAKAKVTEFPVALPSPKKQKTLQITPPAPKEIKNKTTLDPEVYHWHPKDLTLDPTLLSSEFLKNLPNYLKQDSQNKLKDTKDLDAKTAVKLVTLDDLNAPGEYCYLAARKIAQCQFKKEMPKELQKAIADYQNPDFVFQDSVQKKKIITILCEHATNKTTAKALQRLHLVRSDIKYSIEVEVRPTRGKGNRIYDFYKPNEIRSPLIAEYLKDAGLFDKLFDHLNSSGKEKCKGADSAELSSKEWIKKNLTWYDLSSEARVLYTKNMWPLNGDFIAHSPLPSFRKELYWERIGKVCEAKTHTYYESLDQLNFSLRGAISVFGIFGSYNIHSSQHCIHLRSGDAKERGRTMLNVLYGFNFLAMLEHTSKNYFKHSTREPYTLDGLQCLESEFTTADFFGDKPIHPRDLLNIKCHHIGVVPGNKTYQNKDILGFEIRNNNKHENDTVLLLSLMNNAAAFGDIFASDGWKEIAMPHYSEVFLPFRRKSNPVVTGYAKLFAETLQAKKLELSEEKLITFFGTHDGRIALPLVPWEKFPFFPQEELAKIRLDKARELAIQELMELAQKKVKDDATIQAPVKNFIETLKEITATSRQKFRNEIAEMALGIL